MGTGNRAVYLQVEVVGCPTVCQHCWAQGVPYAAMSVSDASCVLHSAHEFCSGNGFAFAAYPMHEVAAHPQAVDIVRLFAAHVGAQEFEPFSTTGVPLAVRDDWRDLLDVLGELGTTTVRLAFHGPSDQHDRLVHRSGAGREARAAVERTHAAGLRVRSTVFLTSDNVAYFAELVRVLEGLDVDEASWEPAHFYPTRRSRRYEALRPSVDELIHLAPRVVEISQFWRERWSDLGSYTEASYVLAAVEERWPDRNGPVETIPLVVRPSLDLHSGKAGVYGKRHGNLRNEKATDVLARAVAHGPRSDDELYLPGLTVPPLDVLARRYGDPDGTAVHFHSESIRYRWLDRAATLGSM